MKFHGQINISGDLTPEQAFQLEQFLNTQIANQVYLNFHVGFRAHIFESSPSPEYLNTRSSEKLTNS